MNGELYEALFEADLAKAEELLRAGADINQRDEVGESLLDALISIFHSETERRTVAKCA